ncbi:unnamed protein product [Phytophthora fragariaefolia]|uniref:Unnamed protein product n=1 Tax=Phytophthora fragariaefolia TaxID=1490495 RepID=A0A9W6YGA1_9STRA|nr:unnamed protein product [Phytophthora fragariaefolia]
MSVRDQKLRNAFDFLMAPGRFVDPDKPHTSDHRYETAEGDLCSVHLEAMHFPGVESLEKVWEALLFHYNTIEIGISERLGHTTVRDDYDNIDGSVYNIRILSQSENCTAVESSIVTFSHFFTESDKGFGGRACGILALDSVDEDELYPYFPDKRVRLDTSGAIILTASRQPAKDPESEGEAELVVTLRRAAFLKLYNPQFPVSEATRQELQAGIGRWGDVLMKTVHYGGVWCVFFHNVCLPDLESIKQVYDAVVSIQSADIMITERLGHVTTRGDYSIEDYNIFTIGLYQQTM